jgi:hypothetical protein
LKIIAAIEDSPVIVKILSHLGLPTRANATGEEAEAIEEALRRQHKARFS